MAIQYPELHATTFKHKELLAEDTYAGCGECTEVVLVSDIAKWCDDAQTALCPKCGVDALVPFLKFRELATVSIGEVRKVWFGWPEGLKGKKINVKEGRVISP